MCYDCQYSNETNRGEPCLTVNGNTGKEDKTGGKPCTRCSLGYPKEQKEDVYEVTRGCVANENTTGCMDITRKKTGVTYLVCYCSTDLCNNKSLPELPLPSTGTKSTPGTSQLAVLAIAILAFVVSYGK